MTRLVVRVTHTADVVIDHLGRRGSHSLGRGEVAEEARSHFVDAAVGALRREHYGHQQLERIVEMQFRLGRRHHTCKIVEHALI